MYLHDGVSRRGVTDPAECTHPTPWRRLPSWGASPGSQVVSSYTLFFPTLVGVIFVAAELNAANFPGARHLEHRVAPCRHDSVSYNCQTSLSLVTDKISRLGEPEPWDFLSFAPLCNAFLRFVLLGDVLLRDSRLFCLRFTSHSFSCIFNDDDGDDDDTHHPGQWPPHLFMPSWPNNVILPSRKGGPSLCTHPI